MMRGVRLLLQWGAGRRGERLWQIGEMTRAWARWLQQAGESRGKGQSGVSVAEWMGGGKYKADSKKTTVIFLVQGVEASGKNHSGVYQQPSTMAAHICCSGVIHHREEALHGRVVERHEQLCTSLGSLKDAWRHRS